MRLDDITPEHTVEEFLGAWLRDYVDVRLRPNTATGYERSVRRHMIPCIGHVRLSELTRSHCQRVVDEAVRSNGFRPASVKSLVWLPMSSAFTFAHQHRLVSFRASKGVMLPSAAPKRIRALGRDEARAYLHAALAPLGMGGEHWYGPFVAAALHTGMRPGEIRGLRWGSVEFFDDPEPDMAGVIRVCEQIDLNQTGTVWSAPKSSAGFRDVPISPDFADILRAHRRRLRTHALRKGTRKWNDCDLVFPSTLGTAAATRMCKTTRHKVARRAGLSPVPTFHDLRHTYVSMMVDAGIEPHVVAEIVGHADVSLTINVYYDVSHDGRRRVSAAVSQALR